ncbi:tetratricopeptide repeat protein [candidate division KSB1 bacterium]
MLDEQLKTNPDYYDFVNKNFIPVRFVPSNPIGKKQFDDFDVSVTPTIMVAETDGSEIDRIIGFSKTTFLSSLNKAYNREDTFIGLKKQYEKNPDDLVVTFKLAYKYQKTMRDENNANELYAKVLERPEEARMIEIEYTEPGETINLYEWALYQRANTGYPNVETYVTLLKEFPDSRFAFDAYDKGSMYMPKDPDPEMEKWFYDSLLEKHPDNLKLLNNYINHFVYAERNTEKVLELCEKVTKDYNALRNINIIFGNYAQLLEKQGDSEKARKIYGPSYASRLISGLDLALGNYVNYWARQDSTPATIEPAADALVKLDRFGRNRSRIASAYLGMGADEKAFEVYGDSFLEENKDDKSATMIISSYANFWARIGKNLESVQKAAELYKEKTNGKELLEIMEKVYRAKGEEALAQEYSDKFFEQNKENDRSLNSYAWTYAMEGKNLENAMRASIHSIELKNDGMYWDTLSMIYWKKGEYQKAVETEEIAIELVGGSNPAYEQRIKDIKEDMAKKGIK